MILLVGHQEDHVACKNWVIGSGVVTCLEQGADVTATSSSLAALKSRMIHLCDVSLPRLYWKRGHTYRQQLEQLDYWSSQCCYLCHFRVVAFRLSDDTKCSGGCRHNVFLSQDLCIATIIKIILSQVFEQWCDDRQRWKHNLSLDHWRNCHPWYNYQPVNINENLIYFTVLFVV